MAHGTARAASGFDLSAVIAEYRALRASVLRLWRDSGPAPDVRDVDDITRFNESIDQSLTYAIRSFAAQVDRDRAALFAREQASREAEAANRAKDEFLAVLSHELRTPLNNIVGWLSLLRDEHVDNRHFQEALRVIERNTKTQAQLVDDLLDVSRIVSGKLRVEIHACELTDVINEGVNAVRPAAEARGVTLNVRLDPLTKTPQSQTVFREFDSTACACSWSMTRPTPGGYWSWCCNKSAPSSPRRAASAKRLRRFPRRALSAASRPT